MVMTSKVYSVVYKKIQPNVFQLVGECIWNDNLSKPIHNIIETDTTISYTLSKENAPLNAKFYFRDIVSSDLKRRLGIESQWRNIWEIIELRR